MSETHCAPYEDDCFQFWAAARAMPFVRLLTGKHIFFHHQCVGLGTATSDMMDMLGLGTAGKRRAAQHRPQRHRRPRAFTSSATRWAAAAAARVADWSFPCL